MLADVGIYIYKYFCGTLASDPPNFIELYTILCPPVEALIPRNILGVCPDERRSVTK
jgi:hypothetical protein